MFKYIATAILLCATPALADIRLPKVLSSHMVLQRNSEVKIWGWADAGEAVEVSGDWLTTPKTATANADGQWQVVVKTGEAGKPHTVTIAGNNRIELRDILFGEVWVASGQSNMEMPLTHMSNAYTGIQNSEQEVAQANYPDIRLFRAGNFSSQKPLDDVEPGIVMYGIPPAPCTWQACTPETVATFSSAAYFFARELHKQLNVPIGILDSAWGGTSAETWTPKFGLEELGYTAALKQAATVPQKSDQKVPTRLYNGMIHPLRNYKINGAIWYQGESNARSAEKYRALFTTMISSWRKVFGYEFSFYYVQIAPYNYGNVNSAYLREAQLESLSFPKTGMAVTMDIGNLKDIHPKNKQEVGRRLALWALAKDYGKSLAYSGPIYRESAFEGGKVRVKFDHVGDGLATSDGAAPTHFEVAGADKVFHAASAVIDGNDVVVTCDQVSQPQAVRYAFSNQAMPNLMNRAGLPASSFRSDRWQP